MHRSATGRPWPPPGSSRGLETFQPAAQERSAQRRAVGAARRWRPGRPSGTAESGLLSTGKRDVRSEPRPFRVRERCTDTHSRSLLTRRGRRRRPSKSPDRHRPPHSGHARTAINIGRSVIQSMFTYTGHRLRRRSPHQSWPLAGYDAYVAGSARRSLPAPRPCNASGSTPSEYSPTRSAWGAPTWSAHERLAPSVPRGPAA